MLGIRKEEKESKSDAQNPFPEFLLYVLTMLCCRYSARCREITARFLEEHISNTNFGDFIFNWDVSTSIFSICRGGSLP